VILVSGPFSNLQIRALETRILELGNRIKIVDGFDQTKINITALSPHRIRLHAEQAGVTTVKLIDEFDNVHQLEVFVEPDTRELKAYLDRLFPDTSIMVVGIRDGVVLRGSVTQPSQIPQIISVAEQFYPVVQPQLTVSGPNQVQLHVKVIEVQRTKLRELGFNFFIVGRDYAIHNGIGALSQVVRQGTDTIVESPSNLRFSIAGNNMAFHGFLQALQQESLAKILAEPVLVTTSGRPATVRSGGSFPIPVSQGLGAVSIEWRDFGVTLEAVPIILGNGWLRLDLAPEVSELDYGNAQNIEGFAVPGVASRSVNTQVEMQFGETLMIGGLISSRKRGTTHKVPFLGELPWIGAAFSKKSHQVGETELVILVTPQMAAPMASHQVPQGGPGLNSSDPTMRELFLDGNLEVPNFGPECPDCPPNGDMIVPQNMTPMIEPVPAVTARSPSSRSSSHGKIQQTSAERIVPSGKEKAPDRAFQSDLNEIRSNNRSSVEVKRSGSQHLPGLIEPQSTANQPASVNY